MRRLKENTMGKTKEDDLPKEMREKIDKLGNKVNSLQEAATMKIDKTVDHQKAIEILEIKEEAKKILEVKEKAKVVKEKRNESIIDPIEEEVIKEMNKQYAIVHTSSTHILIEKGAAGFILDSRSSLIHLHENDFFTNSEGKEINKAKLWLKHRLRRTYVDIVFDVTKPPTFTNDKGQEIYNIFKGFAFEPKKGDASPYWNHVKNVICGGDEALYLSVRKRLASIVQNPKVLGFSIVVRGKQGTGKNQFVEHFGKLFGKNFLTFNSLERLTGRFNSYLQYALVLFANEAIWGGNKKETGAIKSLVTDESIFIEAKGKDGYQIESSRHLFIASNESWAVPRDIDDRRFLVLDVSSKHKENYEYFGDLDDYMKNKGGYEALLYDFQNEDLTNYNPRILPVNNAGFDTKLPTMSTSERYVYYALDEECWHLTGDPRHFEFKNEKVCRDLYGNYKDWCQDEKLVPQSMVEFGKTIMNLVKAKKIRKGTSTRINTYIFPSLKQCRKNFEIYSKETDKIWSDNQ